MQEYLQGMLDNTDTEKLNEIDYKVYLHIKGIVEQYYTEK